MTTQTVALTGIKPTGDLHLGNYVGAIRPLAQLAALRLEARLGAGECHAAQRAAATLRAMHETMGL